MDLTKFTDEDLYQVFVDSPKTKQSVKQKRGFVKLCLNLATELLLFPGQYTTFSFIILADILLRHYYELNFILLKIVFMFLAVVTTLRVPFRIRREYKTLQTYDKIKGDKS